MLFEVEHVDTRDDSLGVSAGPLAVADPRFYLAPFSAKLGLVARIDGHIWTSRLSSSSPAGSGAKLTAWVESAGRESVHNETYLEVVAFDCEHPYCAYLVRNRLSEKVRVEIYKDHKTLVNNSEYTVAFSKRSYSDFQLVRKNESALTVFFTEDFDGKPTWKFREFILDTLSGALRNVSYDTNLYENVRILKWRDATYLKAYDPRKYSAIIGKIGSYGLENKVIVNDVRIHAMVGFGGQLYLLYSKYGLKELSVVAIDQALAESRSLGSDFEEMHSFDSIDCRVATIQEKDSSVECLFSGRIIKVVTISFPEKSSGIKKVSVKVKEEYLGFRNTRWLKVFWNDKWIVGLGEGFNPGLDQGNKVTEASGLLLYGRGQGKYLLQGIDKKELFDQLLANEYQVDLDGDHLYIHGGQCRFLLHYVISEATLSSPKGLSELPTLIVSTMPGEERELSLTSDLKPDSKTKGGSGSGIFGVIVILVVVFGIIGAVGYLIHLRKKKRNSLHQKGQEIAGSFDYSAVNNTYDREKED